MRYWFFYLFLMSALVFSVLPATAQDWKEEFNVICGSTMAADEMTDEELESLLKRAEDLLDKLKGMNDPSLKVYIFRTEKCRDLYKYMVTIRQQGGVQRVP